MATISAFLLKAVSALQAWLGTAALLFLLWGVYLLWTSGDNAMQRSRAWRHLGSVVAGVFLILFAKDLLRLLYSWAGIAAPF